MRASSLLWHTLREEPHTHRKSAALLMRAGYVREDAGMVILLPLGSHSCDRIVERLVGELQTVQYSRTLEEDALEDNLIALLRSEVQSYRELPLRLKIEGFQSDDEPAVVEELLAAETPASLLELADEELQDGLRKLKAWGIPVAETRGSEGRRYLTWDHPEGTLPVALCDRCGARSTATSAAFRRQPAGSKSTGPMQRIQTPGCETIAQLAAFLDISESQTLKAVFLSAEDGLLYLIILQGNYEVSLAKLQELTGQEDFHPATSEEIILAGAVPGYASPVGLRVAAAPGDPGVQVIADVSVTDDIGYVAGANQAGYHLMGVQYPRDFTVTTRADIAEVEEGMPCEHCGNALSLVASFFCASYRPFEKTFSFAAQQGKTALGFAGLLTWNPLSILLAVSQVHADVDGLQMPKEVSPFDVYLVDLKQEEQARSIAATLERHGLSVLHDDRKLSAGVKFKDADLVGFPVRITVSRRSLEQGGVELHFRGHEDAQTDTLEALLPLLTS